MPVSRCQSDDVGENTQRRREVSVKDSAGAVSDSVGVDSAWMTGERRVVLKAVCAKRAVNALVERIRSCTSVAIMPEGTRTPTPTLARLKKGAFHLAMQARVPIVISNVGGLMWRRSR